MKHLKGDRNKVKNNILPAKIKSCSLTAYMTAIDDINKHY